MRRGGVVRAVAIGCAAAALVLTSLPAQAAPGQHRISGTIRAADGGSLPEVYVSLYRQGENGTYTFYAPVDEDPVPSFSVLVPDGQYKVEVSTAAPDLFQDEWYDDQPTRARATPVSVAGADVVLREVALERQPRITGRVVDTAGAPLAGIRVYPLDAVTFNSAWFVETAADGTFDAQVYPGDWTVGFTDRANSVYATEYLGDANSEVTGAVVSVSDGVTDVGTVVMSPGGSISGRVVAPDGYPLAGHAVTVFAHGVEQTVVDTDRAGRYEATVLTPGDYQLRFEDQAGNFATEHNGGAATLAEAAPVPVRDGTDTGGVDASPAVIARPAPPGVDVTGVVTDTSGHPIPGARVSAFAADDPDLVDEPYDSAYADADGRYHLSRLDGRDVSTFLLGFSAYAGAYVPGNYGWPTQWYASPTGATAIADAAPVAVTPGTTVTADLTLPDAGHLRGRTYSTGGTGYPGNADGSVSLFDEHAHRAGIAWVYSDEWDFWGGLAPGRYRLNPDEGINCPVESLPIEVEVRSAQETTVPGAAFCAPATVTPPAVRGTPAVGQTLTADPGTGSADSVVSGYAWLLDGAVAGTGATWTVPETAAGRSVAVRVTRRTDFDCCSPLESTATSPTVTVKRPRFSAASIRGAALG